MCNMCRIYLETNLARPLDSFPDAEVAEDPGNAQSANKLQSQTASLVDLVGRFLILMKIFSSSVLTPDDC